MSVTLVKNETAGDPRSEPEVHAWLFDSSPDCVKIIDLSGALMAMNRNGLCALEIDDFGTVCGTPWVSLWGDDARPLVHDAIVQALAGGVGHFTAYGATAKATPKWWDVMVTPVRDNGGTVQKLLSVSRDVTEVHQARQKAEESEARFRSVVEAVSAIVWVMPPSVMFESAQTEWAQFTGQSFDQMKGHGWLDAVHSQDRDSSAAAARQALETGRRCTFEQRLRRADGQYRHMSVQIVPVFNGDGTIREWIGVHTDITEKKMNALALAEREDRIRLATDVAGLGIWTWSPASDSVHYENERMYQIFGLPAGAAPVTAARFKTDYLYPEDVVHFETAVRATLEQGARFHLQTRIRRPGTDLARWVELSGDLLLGNGGEQTILGVVADITQQKSNEESLRLSSLDIAEADRRKTEFIVTLAHELRNPLAPIRNGLQVMKMAADKPETVARVRGVMERQVSQMVHLIDDLLDVARISRGQIELKKEAVDLKSVAANAVETSLPLIEAGHHELTFDLGDTPFPLFVDAARIAQVLSNLLNNAAKYTPANGRISLTAYRSGDQVVVMVTDSGIGIPAASLPVVFNMFSQVGEHKNRAQGGLGIGLSLVRNLVEMHGGTVTVSSAGSGLGSSFAVHLPLAEGDRNTAALH